MVLKILILKKLKVLKSDIQHISEQRDKLKEDKVYHEVCKKYVDGYWY